MDPEVRELATAAVTALQTMAANSSPHWTDVAGVCVALLVGGTQCGLIAWGIRVMHNSNTTRESRHEEVMTTFAHQSKEEQRRHEETEREAQRRHEETEREAQQRHEETEREAQSRHEEVMADIARRSKEDQSRHEAAMTALTALIERTAPEGNA